MYERILYANKDEQEYFNNKKIFTKQDSEDKQYKRQIPSYFRIMEDPSSSSHLNFQKTKKL